MSNVPVSKRTQSPVEFYNYGIKLHDAILMILLKDFGSKTITRDLNAFAYKAKFSDEDKKAFNGICNKYGINVSVDYPLWLLEYYRDSILNTLYNFRWYITQAYTIYPNSLYEWNLKRAYQWYAIGACEMLLQSMQDVLRIFKTADKDLFMRYTEMITKEIDLLRGWKRSCNKSKKAIIDKENKSDNKSLDDVIKSAEMDASGNLELLDIKKLSEPSVQKSLPTNKRAVK